MLRKKRSRKTIGLAAAGLSLSIMLATGGLIAWAQSRTEDKLMTMEFEEVTE